ncbi:MAG: HNH endonuclease [Chthoniobacterales bacterium]
MLKLPAVPDGSIAYPMLNLPEHTKKEFLRLVVPGSTTACWLWAGDHDGSLRPVFRGEKAYRVMYELRNGDVPAGFHVHRKCENSACMNPRHLVALSPAQHRAAHATKDRAIKEQIYRGEWEQIQAAKAEPAQLAKERYERERLERRRIAAEKEEENRQFAAEAEHWRLEHPWLVDLQRIKYLSIGLICAALTYLLWEWTWSSRDYGWMAFLAGGFWVMTPLALCGLFCILIARSREVPLPPKVERDIKALISSRRNAQRSSEGSSDPDWYRL